MHWGIGDAQLLWDMASLSEFVLWVPLRPWITFHISGSSAFNMEMCRRSFQLLALASLMALFSSQQALIHSCWFWWIVQWRQFWLQIFPQMYGLIQGFCFLLGMVLLMWSEAADRMLLKCEIWIEILSSSRSCCIFGSTSLVIEDQSAPLWHHLVFLGMAGCYLILWLMTMAIGRWSELPIGSDGVHDFLVDQLWPQNDKSGMLLLLVIQLVQVAEPSFRMCRSSLIIQSIILLPWASGYDMIPNMWMVIEVTNDYGVRRWIDDVWIKAGLLSCSCLQTWLNKIFIPAHWKEWSFSKMMLWTKNRRLQPRMLFWSLRMVA